MDPQNKVVRDSMGVITQDPALELPVGAKIDFNYLKFCPIPTDGVKSIANWDAFRGTIVQLHFATADIQQVTGSGVMVSPGVVLAAWHVLEPEAEALHRGEKGGLISALIPGGLMLWRPTSVTWKPGSDIAILTCDAASRLPDGNNLCIAAMAARIPRVGEQVMICGFRTGRSEFYFKDKYSELEGGLYISTGKISQVFANGRDKFLLPFPSFEVDCHTLGCMSGGPCFGEDGRIVGLLATSLEAADLRGPSYVSLLSPVMDVQFQPTWPKGLHNRPTSLLALPDNLCDIDRDVAEVVVAAKDNVTDLGQA